MAEIKDGGPAFPDGTTNEWGYAESKGLSKRDYFAAKAMLGMMSGQVRWADMGVEPRNGCSVMENSAWVAYAMADAMLKAREVQNG